MRTERREFLRIVGASAIGLAAMTRPAGAQDAARAGSRLKMIFRADDVGYTDVCNIGAFESIEKGVVTAADIMLDCPGTVDALKRLKAMPWISVGWHTHFWGSPVLDPREVPSMVIREGGRIRFRKDLSSAKDVVFEEALKECRAQLDRCVKLMGRAPDTGGGRRGDSPFAKAIGQTSTEYKLVSGFAGNATYRDGAMALTDAADKKWADRKIYMSGNVMFRELTTDSLTEIIQKYDPLKLYLEDPTHILDMPQGSTSVQVWHPGYVDYFVLHLGDYGPNANNYLLARCKDVEALTSDSLKNWLKQNRIELISFRDALYGTSEYQNHLKAIGSDLCMI